MSTFHALISASFSALSLKFEIIMKGVTVGRKNKVSYGINVIFFQKTSQPDGSISLLQNSDIEKYISVATSEEKYFLTAFLNGCFSKAPAKIYSF